MSVHISILIPMLEASRKAKADEAANKETDEQTVVLAEDAEKAEKVNRGTENHEESFDHS